MSTTSSPPHLPYLSLLHRESWGWALGKEYVMSSEVKGSEQHRHPGPCKGEDAGKQHFQRPWGGLVPGEVSGMRTGGGTGKGRATSHRALYGGHRDFIFNPEGKGKSPRGRRQNRFSATELNEEMGEGKEARASGELLCPRGGHGGGKLERVGLG